MMYGFGGVFGGWIPLVLWLVILVSVVYLVVYFLDRNHSSNSTRTSAEETLCNRYAQGEIDTETFVQMKNVLKDK